MPPNTMRLHRPALIGARVVWLTLALMILLYLIAGLPYVSINYELPCEQHPSPNCVVVEAGLYAMGLDWSFYVWYSVVWIAAVCVPAFVLCSLLAWRKKDDPQTLLFLIAVLVGLVMNVSYSLQEVVAQNFPAARVVVFVLSYLGQISGILIYVFPDGRFVPRWTRWLAVVFAVLKLIIELVYWWKLPLAGWPSDLFKSVVWGIYPLTLGYALIYRYRKDANREQRQQIKWIAWPIALSCALVTIDAMVGFAGGQIGLDTGAPTWYTIFRAFVSPTVYYVAILLTSLGFYVAIFRYRLWDIDFFINRSLVYGGLTVLLGSVMVGIFAATQALLGIMVRNMQAGAAGIVSLIVAIALFVPVRDRLQRFVDIRFYGVDPGHERAVQAAIAQERDRLSQELHDSVTQSLYGLTIMAESLQRLARDDEAREPLSEMGDVARQALKEMRLLIHELRPPVLEEEGLLSALHQRLAAVEKRSGIEASLKIDEVVDLPVVMEEALYNIAIEALNNAIKHAAATSVSLSLRTDDTGAELEVVDDGKGFDPGSDGTKGGMGVASMRKRAGDLGGKLTIHSMPGQGTKVTARIPYQIVTRKRQTKAVS
jgi:signal transduction histidine kinase